MELISWSNEYELYMPLTVDQPYYSGLLNTCVDFYWPEYDNDNEHWHQNILREIPDVLLLSIALFTDIAKMNEIILN